MFSKYALIAFALVSAVVSQTVEVGYCQVQGSVLNPGLTGYVEFLTNGNMVQMNVNVSGIALNPDSPHGIHIHQFGDLSTSDASRVGSHWNPTNVSHGCPDTAGPRHYGDTGNWTVSGGSIIQTKYLDLISLTGNYSLIGFAVVIHSATDDCATITSSGSRLGQCVIGIANPSNYNATVNNAYPSPQLPYANLTRGICILSSTTGSTANGTVIFEPQGNGSTIRVRAILTGLVDGSVHGFHIHQWGDLRTSNALGTGSHWNPTNSAHGIPPYANRHVGDMGNVYFYENGTAYYEYTFSIFGLNTATYNVIGRAVILHNLTDDCGQPVGNAGSRLAQCVIGYANTVTTYTWPSDVPTSQNDTHCYVSTTGVGATTGVVATTGVAPVATTGVAPVATTGMNMMTGMMESSDAPFMTFLVLLSFIAVLFA